MRRMVFDGDVINSLLRKGEVTTIYAILKIVDLRLLANATVHSVDCKHDDTMTRASLAMYRRRGEGSGARALRAEPGW
jgi:hypothetical protein